MTHPDQWQLASSWNLTTRRRRSRSCYVRWRRTGGIAGREGQRGRDAAGGVEEGIRMGQAMALTTPQCGALMQLNAKRTPVWGAEREDNGVLNRRDEASGVAADGRWEPGPHRRSQSARMPCAWPGLYVARHSSRSRISRHAFSPRNQISPDHVTQKTRRAAGNLSAEWPHRQQCPPSAWGYRADEADCDRVIK